MAPESRLHSHRQCSEPIRRPGRGSDWDRSADGVQQVPESRGHASSDKAQHSPLQGNSCNSYKESIQHSAPFQEEATSDVSTLVRTCLLFLAGLPIWRVHPGAAAVWRQGLRVAAAASKWGFQLQLLAFGGHQRARPHHAPADLRAR